MKLHEVTEDQTAKRLAYLFQQVYRDEHDFNFVLRKKDGYIVGELISEVTGKPFNDVIVFLGGLEVFIIDDLIAFKSHSIPELKRSAIGYTATLDDDSLEAVSKAANDLSLKI